MSNLPVNWVRTTLGSIGFPDRQRRLPNELPNLQFIGMEHLEAHSMKLLGTVPATTMKSAAVHFYPGDVLYGRLRPYLNKVLAARIEGLCSAEFIVFSDHGHINQSWLAYLLNSADFVSFAAHLNEGDRPRVDFAQISPFRVDLPPRPEQDRIVAEIEKQFTRLDAAVAGLKRVQANLKRYRASVLKAACEGRLVPTEAELARKERRNYEPASELLKRILAERRANWEADQLQKMIAGGNPPKNSDWKGNYEEPDKPDMADVSFIPEGWTVASIDQLTSNITSGSRDWSKFYGRGSGIFIMAQNVRLGSMDLSFKQYVDPPSNDASRARSVVCRNDLLVTIVGANTGDICRVTSDLTDHYVCQSVALMRPVSADLARYVELYLCSPENGQRQYFRYIYGAGRPHLSFEQLRMTAVLLPPLAEMRRIVTEVEAKTPCLESVQRTVDNQMAHANALRQGVLRSAFCGNLVPHDSDDEPASGLLERIRVERTAFNSEKKTPKAHRVVSSNITRKRRKHTGLERMGKNKNGL